MDEMVAQFIVEARELVQSAIDDLSALAVDPDSVERLNGAFRAVHTLKGSTALFDMADLQSVLHRAENSLERVRSGSRVLDAEGIDALVAILEWVDACVDEIERGGAISQSLLDTASRFDGALDFQDRTTGETDDAPTSLPVAWAEALSSKADGTCTVALRYRPHPECYFNGDDPIAILSRVPLMRHLSVSPREPWPTPDLYDTFRANLVFEALSAGSVSEIEAIFQLIPDQVEIVPLELERRPRETDADPSLQKSDAARSLRIDATRLDALLQTVGELMTVKNGIGRLISRAQSLDGGEDLTRAIAATQKQLDRVAGTLYGDVLQARMVPVSQAFRRLPRLVRELSRRLGRPAELVIGGDEIEADKTIVDQLFDPLLHLVRNAMDHGVESPLDRLAAGKPANAKLLLQVVQRGEQIVLSLSDDGRGIDPEVIRTNAARRLLLNPEEIARLDDSATFDLLFLAGFSTATEVSDLSGRGVGLDAVRAEISRLGGTVQLSSRVGQGTTFTLYLPVSFAMTQLLLIYVAGEHYGVPMQTVSETVRMNRDAIMPVRGNRAFVLRDRVIPLVTLAPLLGLEQAEADADQSLTILVLTLGNELVGVMVDSIAERTEVLTKPLDGLLTGARGIAGTAVLGNGQVILVLDLAELIQ